MPCVHVLQGTKQRTLELDRKEQQGENFPRLPIIMCFQHLSAFLTVLHSSWEEVKTHSLRSTTMFLCSITVGSSQHFLPIALSQTALHTVPVISGACPKEPSKSPLWQNPHGSALMSNVSFLFKSLEVMRGNIRYKKPCSHCWDLVTAPESQECNLNPSHIKAHADVYFLHR